MSKPVHISRNSWHLFRFFLDIQGNWNGGLGSFREVEMFQSESKIYENKKKWNSNIDLLRRMQKTRSVQNITVKNQTSLGCEEQYL